MGRRYGINTPHHILPNTQVLITRTAVACINTNRNFIGFEIDKRYCDIANERIRKALAEKEVSK